MAYFDRAAADKAQQDRENYEQFKKDVIDVESKSLEANRAKYAKRTGWYTADLKVKKHKYAGALRHMQRIEARMHEMEDSLKKYEKFFGMLRELTPRHSSVHDIIG